MVKKVESKGEKGRFTAKRKTDAVMRVIRGESLDVVSRDLGVTAARIAEWRDQFLLAGEFGLKSRGEDVAEEVIDRLKSKVGELTMENELLRERARAAEGRSPLASRRSRP